MNFRKSVFTLGLLAAVLSLSAAEIQLPAFGLDTVLVWKIQNAGFTSDFVVRIAEFLPDRFLEWEDSVTQGTVFMSSQDVQDATGYVTSQLFESGMDMRSKKSTTLWLSRQVYRDLKAKNKIKITLDGVQGWITLAGTDQYTVEVNKSKIDLPVIRTNDDRGSERWFLDSEDNPLMVRHRIRQYDETLASITTDRPNTLRFIKGRKLPH
jgi:hypothetical protein